MADISLGTYLKSWEKNGRTNLICNLKSLLAKNEMQTVVTWLQKLANHLLTQDSISIDSFVSLIGELFKCLDSRPALEVKVADILWCCESLIHLSTPEITNRFQRLVSQLRNLISEGLLKERLSEDVQESCQLIPTSRQLFQSRYVKTKTRLFYKQHKFNLLREEGEGYAKLATELTQFAPDDPDDYPVEIDNLLRHIKSLIGCFDLDPNRVLDLLLDICESRLDYSDFFILLIERYASDRTDLCHSIGHKFQFYEQDLTTSKALYIMTARLLQAGLIKLTTLYPHLSPADSKNSKLSAIANEMELKKKKKVNPVVDLPPLPDGLPSSDPKIIDLDPPEAEQPPETVMNYEELFGNHQKLDLCEALIVLGDWDNARLLLERFEDPSFPTSYPPLQNALCDLLHWMIDVVYDQCNTVPSDLIKGRKIPNGSYINLRQPQDLTDLVRKTFPIAYVLGPNMHFDQRLLVKFIRICQAYLAQANVGKAEKVDPIYQGIFNLMDYVLLPSLSMIEANCVLSEEIWQTLQHMPYDHRYRLYSQWKNVRDPPASLTAKRNECLSRTKYIVKRLTKDNVKLMGRQLGKLCHSNPCIVFDYVLHSIQRYDNLIGPIVEACKYMSLLSYDVFMYCVIEQLAVNNRLKFEDLQFSPWFQHICNMTGQMCKRYQCDLTGIIQYVLNQLKMGRSYDLLLLRELMHKMTGIEVTEEVTPEQLEAMMGGELLRQEGSYYSQIRNTRKNSQRIKQVLFDNSLALPCVFMMARHRDGLVFREGSEMHLKLCGKLHDQCQDTLVQFGVFIGLNGDELGCPPLGELVTTYHVPVDVAFFILRSFYRNTIAKNFELKRTEICSASGDTNSSVEDFMKAYVSVCHDVTGEVIEQIKPLHSAKVWEELTPHFYVLFWSLQASDLSCPKLAYDRQSLSLRQQLLSLDRDKALSDSKRKKEKERLKMLEERLSQEQKQLQDHVSRVMHRLKQEKDTWFQMRTKTDTITQFLQLCVYPRLAFTTRDALFAAKFIHVLHTLKTPNFSTLICFDRIFNDITLPMTSCTENEAHRYGRFLCAILDLIMRWHSSQDIYNPECSTYPGFVTVFRKGTDSNTKADQLEYENYRHVVHKWHYRITKSTVACLESGSYVQIRNTLIVLIRIMEHYPRIIPFGQALERRLEKLIEEEKENRKDLHALAVSYHGKLKLKRTTWVPDYEFHIKDECTNSSGASGNIGGGIGGLKRKVAASTLSGQTANGEKSGKASKVASPGGVTMSQSNKSSSSGPSSSSQSLNSSSTMNNPSAKSSADRQANTSSGTPPSKRNIMSGDMKSSMGSNAVPSSSSAPSKQEAAQKSLLIAGSNSAIGPNDGPRRMGTGSVSGSGASGGSETTPEMKRRKIESTSQVAAQSRVASHYMKTESISSLGGGGGSSGGSVKRAGAAPNGRNASASPKDGESSRSRNSLSDGDPEVGRRTFKAPASSASGAASSGSGGERRTVLLSETRISGHHHTSGGTSSGTGMRLSDPATRDEDEPEGMSGPATSGRKQMRTNTVKMRSMGGTVKDVPASSSGSGNSIVSVHNMEKRSMKDKDGPGGHLPSGSGSSGAGTWGPKHHARSRSNPRK